MAFGKPAHLVVTAILIFALTFIYTSYVVDPEHAADRLAKQGGTIPGVAPGEPTAGHLDRLVSLTTVVGATYLAAVSLFSEALVARGAALPYEISGGSLLIVVCTVLDIRKQVRDVSLTNARGGRQ
jgi:preprotein translocase subunit SecY